MTRDIVPRSPSDQGRDGSNDVVTLTAGVGARERVGLEVRSLRLRRDFSSEGRPSVRTSRLRSDRFSWLISKGARRARSISPRRAAREDTPRLCVCVRARLHRARASCFRVRACVRERARRLCICVCVRARLVGSGSEVKRRD